MLKVEVTINNHHEVASLVATRVAGIPEPGETCTYDITYHRIYVGQLECEYGSGTKLAREMLRMWDDNIKVIETIKKTIEAKNYKMITEWERQ